MHSTVIAFNATQRAHTLMFRAGDVVRVHRKITEGSKERTQIFEGMILVIRGGQSASPTITVRKVSGGVGVEIIVPVYAPMIQKIDLVKRAKTRRANLGFVRTKPTKKLRFKYTMAGDMIATADQKTVDAPAVDDLTRIEGIGPKIADVFATQGITTYAAVAETTVENLRSILEEAQLAQHDPTTWPHQATLARDGKWDELETLQAELVGGKEVA